MLKWIKRLVGAWMFSGPAANGSGHTEKGEPAWSVVADVPLEVPYGPGGGEKRSGTKQFAGGTKLYVVAIFWVMGGEQVRVVGRPRDSHRHITIVIRSKRLANWRVEQVGNPYVIRQLLANGGIRTKAECERDAATMAGYNGNPIYPPVLLPPLSREET